MIFSAFERTVAMRYLRPRRQEGFISVIAGFSLLGIALGVATLIIVMAVMNGFRQELLSRVLGLNGHMSVHGIHGGLIEFDPLAASVRAVSGVVTVTPIIGGQVMATADGRASGALVRGIRLADFRARPILADNLRQGSLSAFEAGDGVVIGSRLARRLRLNAGDSIKLISPEGTATAFGTVPRVRAYPVAATFNVGMFEYDSAYIYMPLSAAQIYFRMKGAVTSLDVVIEDPDQLRTIRPAILAATGPDVRLIDWRQQNSSFFNALQVERNVMFLILTLIILVAAFNIISGLIMLVKEKGRDIAILRTMGATRGMIMRVFFLSGASIGTIGTLTGVILGLVFCDNIDIIKQWLEALTNTELFAAEIYFLSRLPAEVDPAEVVSVTLMALGLSLLATIYPSWRAARLDPVEALRNE